MQILTRLLTLGFLITAAAPRVDAQIIETVAGNGTPGYSGDGGAAVLAQLNQPHGLAVDASGNVFIADTENHVIRRVEAATGVIATTAGSGVAGFAGDGGLAVSAQLFEPTGVAVDANGNVFIADHSNHRVRMVIAENGAITTIAGTGSPGYSGDGGSALAAQLKYPTSVAVDVSGVVFVADKNNFVVRKVTLSTGMITTVAGTGTRGYSGDGGPAVAAQLSDPNGVALDASGNLFITDADNNVVRRVDAASQTITTIAGTGMPGFSGDGGPATAAQLNNASNTVAIDAVGNVFIADSFNYRIREVDATTQVITTVAGTGVPGYAGDGGPSTAAQLLLPEGVASSPTGDVLFNDEYAHVIRRITAPWPFSYTICPLFDQTKAVKSGSTIPIKLQLCDAAGTNLSSPAITVEATQLVRTSDSAPGQLMDSGNSNPDDNFRYDASLAGYIFNLKTAGLTTGTYALRFLAGSDPNIHAVQFQVK